MVGRVDHLEKPSRLGVLSRMLFFLVIRIRDLGSDLNLQEIAVLLGSGENLLPWEIKPDSDDSGGASSTDSTENMEAEMLNSYIGGPTSFYERPSLACLETAQCLFQQLLSTRRMPSDDKRWNTLGFTLKRFVEADQEFAVVSESSKIRGRGGGFYIIKLVTATNSSRPEQPYNVVLQAMHTPSDLHIHRVAYRLLLESRIYVAAGWNTVHRSKGDLGKEPMSYFNSFTAAVARSMNKPRIVQLHAFDAKSHKIDGDMILSSSRYQETSEVYERVVSKLRAELKGYVILHFPRDIRQLGGTLNVNARLFYETNPQGLFFHVEMSLPLRLELKDRTELRDRFTACFAW